jgi:hypothetical protein
VGVVAVGRPKPITEVGKAERLVSGPRPPSRRDGDDVSADRFAMFHRQIISAHRSWRKGDDRLNRFWLRSIKAGNRLSCGFWLRERRLREILTFLVS